MSIAWVEKPGRYGEIRERFAGFVFVALALLLVEARVLAAPEGNDREDAEVAAIAASTSERIRSLAVDVEIRRDGSVLFEQRFHLGVAGSAIHRGPVLNYLTVFEGPGGLILDNELEILEVKRDGQPEPHRLERHDGFATLFVGDSGVELSHGEHSYSVRWLTRSDWRKLDGEFSTAIDVVGPFGKLPIDAAKVTVRLPEAVHVSRFSPAVTGVGPAADAGTGMGGRPAYETELVGNVLTVATTGPMGEDRSFFVNLVWPSGTFGTKSHWLMVMRQHPRLPLAGVSALLLAWALGLLLIRLMRGKEVTEAGMF